MYRLCFCSVVLLFSATFTTTLIAQPKTHIETTVITATREEKSQRDVDESVSVFKKKTIDFVSPAHPSEVLNRSAGVHVNNLGGEGHMTAIRQPISTGGVYLFLEDGLPTRPTGLFNHNGLYEINVPQADRIEVIKGPGSALYGSDSIGGIINVITRPSPMEATSELKAEYGSYGWKRLLLTTGAPINESLGFRVDANLTHHDGYRDESTYERFSTTARLDGLLGDTGSYKTILSYSQIDQTGVSGLNQTDYLHNPKKNVYHNRVGRREVDALRLSTEFTYEPDERRLLTFTPFFRNNQMNLMPSWMLTYDPNDRDYQFQSYGFLSKYREKSADGRSEWIVGLDVDYTPSTYEEIRLSTTKVGSLYTDTAATGRTNYDFNADQLSISPYIHGEWQATDRWRLTGGVRYDYFYVDYQDNLPSTVVQQKFGQGGFNHQRPASQDLSYDHFSPKLGLIYQATERHNLYGHYRHSFRTPSMGRLFRSGSSGQTDQLSSVETDSFEVGARGQLTEWLTYNLAAYHMTIKNDIVSYIDQVSKTRRVTNAGQTTHRGIELDLRSELTNEWTIQTAWSVSDQTYDEYTAVFGFPATQINYAGNRVAKAPRTLGNLAIQYRPSYLDSVQFELEWEHLGKYHTDETNTQSYSGHNLINFRGQYDLTDTVKLQGRVMNLTDKRYSTYTSNRVGSPNIEYRPGLPRTFYMAVQVTF